MNCLRSVVCLGVIFLLTACTTAWQKSEPPGVAVTSVAVGSADGLSQTFVIGLTITNPNRTPLVIEGLAYSLSLNGYRLLQGVQSDVPVVEPYHEASVQLSARTNLVNGLRFLNQYLQQGASAEVTYALEAKLDLGGLFGAVNVVEKGVLPGLDGLGGNNALAR